MSNGRLLRSLGAVLLAHGVLLASLGNSYARLWRLGPAANRYRRGAEWIAGWPTWLLRLVGIGETALGLAALGRAPLAVRDVYHLLAPTYEGVNYVWRNWLFGDIHRAFDREVSALLPPGGRVLDLGCGTGANLERLLDLGLPFGSYLGVDLSKDMLARARAKFAVVPNATFEQVDLVRDPAPGACFDLIISTWMLSHLPSPQTVVDKAWERLNPNGHVILLFLTESGSRLDRVSRSVLGFFATRPLAESGYRHFPGLVSLRRFSGGTSALAVLRKAEG